MNEIEFLERLKKLYAMSRYSKTELAQAMGRSVSTYNKIVEGKSKLTVADFLRLCENLRIEPLQFFIINPTKNFEFNRQKRLVEKIQKLPIQDIRLIEDFISPIIRRNEKR